LGLKTWFQPVYSCTVAECFTANDSDQASPTKTFEKKLFLMCTDKMKEHFSKVSNLLMKGRSSFILFGIEAHVCVQQTALDLLEGHEVHIVVD